MHRTFVPPLLLALLVSSCGRDQAMPPQAASSQSAPTVTIPPVSLEASAASRYLAVQRCEIEENGGSIYCVVKNLSAEQIPDIDKAFSLVAVSYSVDGVKVDERSSSFWGSLDANGATKVQVGHMRTQPARVVIKDR
jgi:hypothetical protein